MDFWGNQEITHGYSVEGIDLFIDSCHNKERTGGTVRVLVMDGSPWSVLYTIPFQSVYVALKHVDPGVGVEIAVVIQFSSTRFTGSPTKRVEEGGIPVAVSMPIPGSTGMEAVYPYWNGMDTVLIGGIYLWRGFELFY